MTAVTNYLNIIIKNPLYLGAVILILVLCVGFVAYRLTRKKKAKPELEEKPLVKPDSITKAAQIITKKGVKVEAEAPKVPASLKILLGTGKYKCMAIRSAKVLGLMPGTNIIDFTVMPEPIGEVHIADTSCPISGAIYTVKENDDGTISDYDPREVVIDVEQSPEHSYFASHWPIVHEVFGIPVSPLSNPSFWFAVAALIGAIFMGLATVGG